MFETHDELDKRYCALRDSRNGPVFFIEHGFNEKEIVELVTAVRQALSVLPLDSHRWDSHYLPLIVTATEVGYQYQGTGTDFWPQLEIQFDLHISVSDRQRIRDLFYRAAKLYRGATPPSTPWATAFRLIAWPITHALVPREFHRSFSRALANLKVNVTDLSDGELHRAIRIAASQPSARFLTLLEEEELIVAATRGLLGIPSEELCSDTLQRIASDLDEDQVSRRRVAAARRFQRSSAARRTPKETSDKKLSPIIGSLQLRYRNGTLSLQARFPQAPAELQSKLRQALRNRRYAPKLWGVTSPVPSPQLLSGMPFSLKLTELPDAETKLLTDELDLDRELLEVLAAFELDIAPPLLFAVSADEELGRQIRGQKITGHRKYWFLSESVNVGTDCPMLGKVGPYTCYLLDPEHDTGLDVLRELGFHVYFSISLELIGAPPIDPEASIPAFTEGDQLLLVPRRDHPDDLAIELGEKQAFLSDDNVVSISVQRGEHILRASTAEENNDFAFQVLPAQPTTYMGSCSIEPRTGDISVQALLRGVLSFAIESHAPLQGLELTVEIRTTNHCAHATAPLDALPCVVFSDQEPFETLLDDETRELLSRTPSPELRLRVGHLCEYFLVLEQRVRPCWWEKADDGRVILLSELGEMEFGSVVENDPTADPSLSLNDTTDKLVLLAPIHLDASEHGSAAEFTTFCVSPNQWAPRESLLEKPRLLRGRLSDGVALGIEDLVRSYLRWTLAETDNILANLRRRLIVAQLDRWLVEVCCGQAWATREASLDEEADPWALLKQAILKSELYHDDYVLLTTAQKEHLSSILSSEIRKEIPHLWTLASALHYRLDTRDYEVLNKTFEPAYEKLRESHPGIDDPDIYHDESKWNQVLEQVTSSIELHSLASLLLPTNTVSRLLPLDPHLMTLAELTDELYQWAKDAEKALVGGLPSKDKLTTILAIWVEPEFAIRNDWRNALELLVVDRAIARAARYLALRSRQITRGGDS